MLDEFVPSKAAQNATSTPPVPDTPGANADLTEGVSDEDFAAQLQAGMKDLLGELETSPDMQAQFESMLKEFGGTAAPGGSADTNTTAKPITSNSKSKSGPAAAAGEESFRSKRLWSA